MARKINSLEDAHCVRDAESAFGGKALLPPKYSIAPPKLWCASSDTRFSRVVSLSRQAQPLNFASRAVRRVEKAGPLGLSADHRRRIKPLVSCRLCAVAQTDEAVRGRGPVLVERQSDGRSVMSLPAPSQAISSALYPSRSSCGSCENIETDKHPALRIASELPPPTIADVLDG